MVVIVVWYSSSSRVCLKRILVVATIFGAAVSVVVVR